MKNLYLLILAVFVCVAFAAVNGTTPKPEMTRCVDYSSHVVSDQLCDASIPQVHVAGSLNPQPMYRRYYGGYNSHDLGSLAWGGSDRPLQGHSYEGSTGAEDAAPAAEQQQAGFYMGAGGR